MCQRTCAATPSPEFIPLIIPSIQHHPRPGTLTISPGAEYNGADCRHLSIRGTLRSVNGAFVFVSDLGIMAKVDVEHTLNGQYHIDYATRALIGQTYALLHAVVFLVRSHALLGRNGAASKRTYAQNTLMQIFMSLTLKTHLSNVFIYGLRQILFMAYLWKFYQITINKESWI